MACPSCQYVSDPEGDNSILWSLTRGHWIVSPASQGNEHNHTITDWMNAIWSQPSTISCPNCQTKMHEETVYDTPPNFLAFIVSLTGAIIEPQIVLPNHGQMYRLCGIIYFHDFHFVSRVVEGNGDIWYHDGITQQESLAYVGNTVNIDKIDLNKAGSYKASVAIYTRL